MTRPQSARLAFALVANAALLGTAAGQQFSWQAASSGNWETAANWSPSGTPTNSLHSAVLGFTSPYLVLLNSSPTLGSLNISNPLAELYIAPGRALAIRAGGAIVNGQIFINSDVDGVGSYSATYLTLSEGATLSGSGGITLVPYGASSPRARISTAGNNTASATIGSGITIDGTGYLEGKLTNQGIISGGPGEGPSITGIVTQTGPGKISVNSSGTAASIGGGGTLVGGTIETTNGGVFLATGTGTISGSTITAGSLAGVVSGANLLVTGSLTTHGELRVNNGSYSATYLTLANGATLAGSGKVTLIPYGATSPRARLSTTNNNTDVGYIAPGLTIDGAGYIEGKFTSQGIIGGGPGDGPSIVGTVNQVGPGKVSVTTSGTVASLGNGGTLTGGLIETSNGGAFTVVGAGTISGVAITGGSVATINSGANLLVAGSVAVNGSLRVNNGDYSATYLTLADGAAINGQGKVTLVPYGSSSFRAHLATANNNSAVGTLGAGVTLDGVGYIDGVIKHNGTFAPGNGFGNIQVVGNLVQSPTSRTEIQIGGPSDSQRDSITGSGTVTLAGKLVLQLIGGYSLPTNSTYKFINVGQLKGQFDAIEAPSAPGGVWRVRYGSTSATLVFACKADFNADGFLTFEDFDEFVAAFNDGKPIADFDQDGFLTYEDFDAFVNAFQSGC